MTALHAVLINACVHGEYIANLQWGGGLEGQCGSLRCDPGGGLALGLLPSSSSSWSPDPGSFPHQVLSLYSVSLGACRPCSSET